MWNACGNDIQMTAGDYGITLPITITGVSLTSADEIRLAIKSRSATVLEKVMTPEDNTVELLLTAEESETLTPGAYTYNLDWYQDGVFMCNIVVGGRFVVIAK